MDYQIHKIAFYGQDNFRIIKPMHQWDVGQAFYFKEDFPAGTEVQFSDGSKKVIVNHQISVPDKFLKVSGNDRCWIQVIGSDNETTVKTIEYTIIPRTKKSDYVEPDDEDTFREDIQALVEQAKDIADEAKETADDAKEVADSAYALAGDLNAKIASVEATYTQASDKAASAAQSATESAASASLAESYAEAAEQSAANAGYMYFAINENGHLIETRTGDTTVSFQLNNGRLEVIV